MVGVGSGAHAADIQVDTTEDGYGNGPGCTLREAIHAANSNAFFDYCPTGTAGRDVIALQAGTYQLTVPGAGDIDQGDLDVFEDLTIRGAGAGRTVIQIVGLTERVFDVHPGVDLRLSDLTIRGGQTTEGGGGVRAVGSQLTLLRAAVRDNQASDGGGILVMAGGLTVRDSVIARNKATANNLNGAGILHLPTAPLLIVDSLISGNEAGTTGSPGGGISSYSDAAEVRNSTISGNEGTDGVGIFNSSTMAIVNSTITGNLAPGGDSAGIRNDGQMTLRHITLADNEALTNDALRNFGMVDVRGSILAGHCGGALTSLGHNVRTETSCSLTHSTDRTADPRLLPLRDNGGPTATRGLKNGSPARSLVPKSLCATADQRGAPRKGSHCDAGAYHYSTCMGVVVNRVGTSGKDTITGTKGRDGVLGLGGNDVIRTKGGNDAVCAGPGKDRVYGGAGHDKLRGEGGNDLLAGGPGNDLLVGGPGKDTCKGGPGRDRFWSCERRN